MQFYKSFTALAVVGLTVAATPSVNVALQASFDSGPYLLELLETAAEENSTAYFPLLDRIAEGTFDDYPTDQALYERFLDVVRDDGHLRTAEGLSSFKLSLAMRATAPRIAAHYQFYNTSVQDPSTAAQDAACPVWVYLNEKQYCSAEMERAQQDLADEGTDRVLPFDRVLGDKSLEAAAVLYADITSPLFRDFHRSLTVMARDGQVSYRVRYRPSLRDSSPQPLFVTGYGVELALKKTDYIVVDDRDAPDTIAKDAQTTEENDLKPLSSSEVSRLGVNAVSYVMNSASPLESLVNLTQDFPKYSSQVAAHEPSDTLVDTLRRTRGRMLPPGMNVIWINGVQMDARRIDAFSLLDRLRRERTLVEQFRELGLSGTEAVGLIAHPVLGEASLEKPQRFNYWDEDVILWLNDIENDERIRQWPNDVTAYLQRTYPGQLPPVRRNLHNVVFPVDLSNLEDVRFVVQNLQMFVKRSIPVRVGLVPTNMRDHSIAQSKVAHYLHDTFGAMTLLQYLELSLAKGKTGLPDEAVFATVTKDKEMNTFNTTFRNTYKNNMKMKILTLDQVLESRDYHEINLSISYYRDRLGIDDPQADFFANGVPIPRGSSWMQDLSKQITSDLQLARQSIFEDEIENDTWLPGFFLSDAFFYRNTRVTPPNPKDVKILDMGLVDDDLEALLPRLPSESSRAVDSVHVLIVADFESRGGSDLLIEALEFRAQHSEVEMVFLHRGERAIRLNGLEKMDGVRVSSQIDEDPAVSADSKARMQKLASSLVTRNGIIMNGRAIDLGSRSLGTGFNELLAYEKARRITPVAKALDDLGYASKVHSPLSFSRLTSLVARSSSPESEGPFDEPEVRTNLFNWTASECVLTTGTTAKDDNASIHIVASIDPTSETAQKWLPILHVLTQLDGVQLKVFLNPREQIQELPIKRFYRYMLDAAPSFAADGSLAQPTVSFAGIPAAPLLTLGMDVPSSWLVAPKDSVHDLDNIKLGSVRGDSVDAVYALEHILIEGHSRDMTDLSPPRGVQLDLGTARDPHFSDTIVMANLGYFQFKARPGVWQIGLKEGRSRQIFGIKSLGHQDETEVALLSFQGVTLFPQLSRRDGQENEDVLSSDHSSLVDTVAGIASRALSSWGIHSPSLTNTLSWGRGWGQGRGQQHADINIFSVASGHLYERMLNIMMLSVMKHTSHSVKFWFIEQFLSPSFKAFLPHLAREYNFSYEMVTFKWPHWLRAQTEKQRQIWGYKILFLDVLFPLSLDKVIFVDADQIVRTDMYDLVSYPIPDADPSTGAAGAPYAFPPMCSSRPEIEGYRFWNQGYWRTFLKGKPYHISALYVVDLKRFRAQAAGDRLRGQYQMLSADAGSLSNLDQDLPNHMQHNLPVHTLPQEWLWCETWCADADLEKAKTIDLCNNPMTKEPKLDRARRQIPEWNGYDEEVSALAQRVKLEDEQEQERLRDEALQEGQDDGQHDEL